MALHYKRIIIDSMYEPRRQLSVIRT